MWPLTVYLVLTVGEESCSSENCKEGDARAEGGLGAGSPAGEDCPPSPAIVLL